MRRVLCSDPGWCVYALGDLDPRRFIHCEWRVNDDDSAVVLLYGEFGEPVLFALGDPGAVLALLEEAPVSGAVHLQVRPELVEALAARWTIHQKKPALRMVLAGLRECDTARAVRLGPSDLQAILRLYGDGAAAGEEPDFFFPAMVTEGVFFGVPEGGELVAVAGTHLVAWCERVAAIGNVYTRRDRRRRGLAGMLTAAVAGELQRAGIETIALNVYEGNGAAIRVYERLGFQRHCRFYEGSVTAP